MSSSSRYYKRWKIAWAFLCRTFEQVLEVKLRHGNLPGSLCFVRLEVGVGGGVLPVPWAFDMYIDSVDSREPAG